MQKTAIVTGGSKGIGAAIVRRFVEEGWRVVFSARTSSGLEQELGDAVRFVQGDVGKQDAHEALVKAAVEWTGRLDAYINNAGVSIWKPVLEVTDKFLSQLIDTNIKGAYWGCQAAAKHFCAQNASGAIINVSSLAGKRGSANNSVYCATKFAMNGMTQAMAKELGKSGIRVNAVCPVYVLTDSLRASLREAVSPAQGVDDVDGFVKDFARQQAALGRIPEADEVAKLCLYLAGDGASAVTGQCINVDCGVLPS